MSINGRCNEMQWSMRLGKWKGKKEMESSLLAVLVKESG